MSVNVLRFDFLARDQFSPTAAKVGKETDGLGTKVAKFGKFAGAALIGVGTAAAGLAVAGVSLGVKTAAGLEQAQIGFASLLHSGTQAQVFLKGLTAFAAATPFTLNGLIDSSRTLIGVGVSAKDTMKILNNFGDASSAVGLSQESFQRIMVATSQAIGAGRFQTADLNQIMNNGLPIWHILSEATGKNTIQLRQMASSGKLLAKDVMPELQAQMHKDYGGAMIKQSETLNGLWSTFTDTISLGLAKAIGPMIPMLKIGLAGASTVAAKALSYLPTVLDDGVAAFKISRNYIMTDFVPTMRMGMRDVTTAFGVSRDFIVTQFVPALRTAFGDVAKIVSHVNFAGIGNQIKIDAMSWGTPIIDGVTIGLSQGNWKPLGKSLGFGISQAFSATLTGGVSLSGKFGGFLLKMFGSIDWYGLGKSVGLGAFPFVVGFNNTLIDGLFSVIKQHPLDVALLVLAFIPLGKLGAAFGPARDLIEKLPFGSWVTSALDHSAAPAYDGAIKFVKFVSSAFVDGFREVLPASESEVIRFVTRLGDDVRLRALYMVDAAAKFAEGISIGIGREAGKIVFTIRQVIGWLVDPFIRADSWLIDSGRNLIRGLIDGMDNMSSGVRQEITSGIRSIRGEFTGAGTWLYSAGRNILMGLRDGMFDEVQSAGDWAGHIGGRIVSSVKGYFGIHSPSRVMHAIGTNLIESLFGAMLAHNPVAAVTRIFGGMPQALGALVGKGLVHLDGLPGKALSALTGLGGTFASAVGGLFGGGGGGLSGSERYIISHESGGRTNAQNPTSTAFGLGQLILANRQHYGAILGVSPSTTDYGSQLAMFRMYVKDRYGNANNAAAFWAAHHFYDAGGVASGVGYMAKGTLQPERVLSPRQTMAFERMVRVMDSGGGTSDVHYHFPNYIGSQDDLVRTLNQLNRHGRLESIKR